MEIDEPFLVYNADALGHAVKHFREQAGLTQTNNGYTLCYPKIGWQRVAM